MRERRNNMFDINKVNMNDLETLLKVFTSGICAYDYELEWRQDEAPFVVVTISKGERSYRYNSELDKAFLARFENMFFEIYKHLLIPDPEIEYKKRRYYLYS